VISKTRVKTLKQKRANKTAGGLTNGHAHDEVEELNEDGEEFINDCHNGIAEKPEFFKYFGNKCATPCFVPEQMAFQKLTPGNLAKESKGHMINIRELQIFWKFTQN
jgi:hypothetical protein